MSSSFELTGCQTAALEPLLAFVRVVMSRFRATRAIENSIRNSGFARVAGVDEVGRGCLAGPVVAASVILNPKHRIIGIRDSKLLSSSVRLRLFEQIITSAESWSIGLLEPEEIDRLNIHRASLQAMRQAVTGLLPSPNFVLVDAFKIPNLSIPQRAILKGDERCTVIAAASIVAKVIRDREMEELHKREPRYGFDRHKGYATEIHLAALAQFGSSEFHRQSFRPVSLITSIQGERS